MPTSTFDFDLVMTAESLWVRPPIVLPGLPNKPVRRNPTGLLTLREAAAYLNITDEQVAAFVADGALDYINVGRGNKRPRIPLHQARP